MECERGVPPGVAWQVIGEHSGNKVLQGNKAVDDESGQPHQFICTKLVHFTENTFAEMIGLLDTDEPFCFKPYSWCAIETNPLNLTWWSPIPPANWNKGRGTTIYDSSAVGGPSLCGPIGFVAPWKDILEEYARGRRETSNEGASSEVKIQLRNLGTYRYRKEIMYAVLVCMEGDITDNNFPVISLSDGTEAIRFENNSYSDDFIWKVYSTVSKGDVVSWDHLTFAFNCPNSNFNIQPGIFSIEGKKADKYRPHSRIDSRERTLEEMIPSGDIINELNAKIQRMR